MGFELPGKRRAGVLTAIVLAFIVLRVGGVLIWLFSYNVNPDMYNAFNTLYPNIYSGSNAYAVVTGVITWSPLWIVLGVIVYVIVQGQRRSDY